MENKHKNETLVLRNEPLSKHTTFKIGGKADYFIVPQDKEYLMRYVKELHRFGVPYFVIGKGANILIPDDGIRGVVIKNESACRDFIINENRVQVGSSISLQKFVMTLVRHNLFGMEFLISIPGTIGGSIWMNAGRGSRFDETISKYLISVEYFDGSDIKMLDKDACSFGHRTSVFQKHRDWIILSAQFILPSQDENIGRNKIRERLNAIKRAQDLRYPSAGTAFSSNFKPLPEIRERQFGKARFSEISPGWIINLGGATFKDVYRLIQYVRFCHLRRFLRLPRLEIVVFRNLFLNRIGLASRLKRLIAEMEL